MPRPGAVIEVDRNTPPVLFHFGEGIRLEKLPLGARIVYPPDPLESIAHPERAATTMKYPRKRFRNWCQQARRFAELADESAKAKRA